MSRVLLALVIASTLSPALFVARTTHEPIPVVVNAPVVASTLHGPLTFAYVIAPLPVPPFASNTVDESP